MLPVFALFVIFAVSQLQQIIGEKNAKSNEQHYDVLRFCNFINNENHSKPVQAGTRCVDMDPVKCQQTFPLTSGYNQTKNCPHHNTMVNSKCYDLSMYDEIINCRQTCVVCCMSKDIIREELTKLKKQGH